ncbi:hypothetical protein SD37_09830 [Amycolatopsis orientalis]|uniref:Lysine transporter LysE n=1 Tax=Amycolatopsis orientalis TaxID=31958 RepID=A0A193BUM2_AMYOR|nr:LysE family transporter [Amycolatopsis orientalis]ANN15912.1 hypothetical protein SD37_09830 [Amycolatopsis orientalis]
MNTSTSATLFSVTFVYLAATMTPGPNFVYLTSIASTSPRRIALSAALGMTTGTLVLASLGALGTAALLGRSPVFDVVLHAAGGLYLAYLGVKLWRGARRGVTEFNKEQGASPQRTYLTGMVTVLSNPKGVIFFGSVLTTLVPPSASSALRVAATLAIVVSSLCWHSFVAVIFSTAAVQSFYSRLKPFMNRVFGAVLVGLGVALVASIA